MATGRLPDPNTAPVTAKGDLYTYSTVPAKLAVGSDGETLVADSSATTGLRWQGNFAAGKNKIINGDFGIWQRGTSFTLSSGVDTYCADRFLFAAYGSGTAGTGSRQTFTAGTAPVAGYEGQYFGRITNFATASAWQFRQRMENVQTFAGQTITFSFWAKASASMSNITVAATQNFGSGGSTAVSFDFANGVTLTTSWTRYSYTYTVPSISGKTIGTGSYFEVTFYQGSGATNSGTIDTWGWQVENGNTATAFQTATGTLAGELAACQRYYFRTTGGNGYQPVGSGFASSATNVMGYIQFPVPMRTTPSTIEYATLQCNDSSVGNTVSAVAFSGSESGPSAATLNFTTTGMTTYRPTKIIQNNSASGYLALSAEL